MNVVKSTHGGPGDWCDKSCAVHNDVGGVGRSLQEPGIKTLVFQEVKKPF